MENTITGKSLDKLEEKLASYTTLIAEKKELVGRLDNVENEKSSVNDNIYEKVKAEYARKLEDICSRLEPIESEFEEARQESESRMTEISDHIRSLEEELAEAEFRCRVGEYEQSKFEEIRSRLEPEIKENTENKTELSEFLSAIGSKEKTAGPTEKTPKETMAFDLSDDEDSPAVDNDSSSAQTTPANESSFENPQDWIDEIGPDKKKSPSGNKAPGSSAQNKHSDNDPLTALADPSDEHHENVKKGSREKKPREACVEFPNLVIVSGPNAGRKIPVLPMTMSIGREHDNNIELKDPEIARYHARIVHEKGQFILDDLESSSGTWLNGERIKQTALKNGDRIKIGETEIVLDFD